MRPALYLDRWVADPGERIRIMATGDGAGRASLVRLRGLVGDGLPHAYIEQSTASSTPITLVDRAVPTGSFAIAKDGPTVAAGSSWSWRMRLFPTLVDRGEILGWGDDGPRLFVRDGALVARFGAGCVELPIVAGHWVDVALAYALHTGLVLSSQPVGTGRWYRRAHEAAMACAGAGVAGPLAFGRGFNGKIDGPALAVDGNSVARWNFAAAMTRQHVPGEGPQARRLELVNAPRRAVTSADWTGEAHDWSLKPDHYAAIHFHDDDLSDCGWPVDAELVVPPYAASGVYAVRVENARGVRHTPLFVRPQRPAAIAFLASTLSYLAYGNSIWDSRAETDWEGHDLSERLAASRYGRSTYCRHRDGTGIGLVSMRRPILSFTPGFAGEAIGSQVLFNDDMRIIQWLDRVGEPYDVITDHDLHERGPQALAPYRAVVTGVHPEYHSFETLDAIEAFTGRGGRLMYMGGNGFYWRVSTLPDAPHVMELRRAEGGIRTWPEVPNEYIHQSDGKLGGLWRRLGRPPNRLVGVGFSAQGSEQVTRGYVATQAAHDPRAAFLFDGVTVPVIGAGGPLGGAAGYETDRADFALGTPPHTLVVARSEPFDAGVSPVNEERLTDVLITATDPLRADIGFFEGPNGGAVFSVGSILFAAHLGEDDGAGRLATNCLVRFARPEPFEIPEP